MTAAAPSPLQDRLNRRLRGLIRRHSNLRSLAIIGAAVLAAAFLAASVVDVLEFRSRLGAAQHTDFASAYAAVTGSADRAEASGSITSAAVSLLVGQAAPAASVPFDGVAVRAEVDNFWLFLVREDGSEVAAQIPPYATELLSSLYAEARIPVEYLGVRTTPMAVIQGIIAGGFVMWIATYMMTMTGWGRTIGSLLRVEDIQQGFSDVAGADEAKNDLLEFVRMIRGEINYARLGAKTPRGVLLYGPPGTGKTLLARATAGEAGVNFLACTGSDFGGMLVGQGGRDVQNLFRRARGLAPCIIFIDEIDSIGKKRGQRSHDDYETTLNKLLAELDGVEGRDDIYVMAATNHPSALDDALVRPGRFDRIIRVPLPDLRARRRLLDVHTRDMTSVLAPDLDLDMIARKTAGLSGAQLENLCNEAGIQAGRDNAQTVTYEHFDRALLKINFGEGSQGMALTDFERNLVAYHEAGHALLALHEPSSDPIQRVTIEPRGETLGHVYQVPETELRVTSIASLHARMRILAAGRAAEIVVFGDQNASTLAGADIQMISRIALDMTHKLGMSSKGGFFTEPMESPLAGHSGVVLGDARAMADKALEDAKGILAVRRADLETIAQALLEKETLTGDEIRTLVAPAAPLVPVQRVAAE